MKIILEKTVSEPQLRVHVEKKYDYDNLKDLMDNLLLPLIKNLDYTEEDIISFFDEYIKSKKPSN